MAARLTAFLLAIAVTAVVAAGADARGLPARCATLAAHRTHPAITSFDVRPGAPRIFAMQYRQAAANVVSYASFRTKVDCMLRT